MRHAIRNREQPSPNSVCRESSPPLRAEEVGNCNNGNQTPFEFSCRFVKSVVNFSALFRRGSPWFFVIHAVSLGRGRSRPNLRLIIILEMVSKSVLIPCWVVGNTILTGGSRERRDLVC